MGHIIAEDVDTVFVMEPSGAMGFTSLLSWYVHLLRFLFHTCRFTLGVSILLRKNMSGKEEGGGKGSDDHREPGACHAVCPAYRGHAVIGSYHHSVGQLLACPFYRW